MNTFALGMLAAALITTQEGNNALKSTAKLANVVLKKKYNINLKELLEDDELIEAIVVEQEVVSNDE